jgi:hypothetical protein
MSSQLQYLLIGACILGFAAMELITRRYQATVRDNATANDTWLEVLMFVSLIAITQPIALHARAAQRLGQPAVVGHGRSAADRR